MQESENEYFVEKILKKRYIKGKPEYLIKWLGFPENQSTWEPLSNLKKIMRWVEEFNRNNKGYNSNDDASEYEDTCIPNNNCRKKNVSTKEELDNELIYIADEKDIPLKIITARYIDNILYFLVEWDIRPDGVKVEDSFVKNDYMKDNYPKLLIEFYESKIKFIDVQNK